MLLRLLSSVFLFATASYCVAQGLSNYEKANQAFQAGNIDESYIHLKNSLDENPDHLPSKILVGHVLGLSGYFAEAELELNEALSQGADPNLVIEPLINILMAQAKYEELNNLSNRQLTPRIEAILLSSQAVAHARLGDLERARDLHEDASDLAPNNVLVKNAYAYFLSEAGQLDTALEVINQSLNLATDQASSYIIQANIFKLRDMREAEAAALQKALSIDPKHPVVLRELIASLNAQEKFQEAKVILERTLTLSPDDPVGQLLLSWVASKLNDNDLAGETLNKLINNLSLLDDDALNNNEELLFISGMANFASNNIEVAKEDLNQYLFKRPSNIQAAKVLVDIYKSEQNYTGAIGVLENYQSTMDSDLPLAMTLCELYISANLNHKCAWLMSRLEKRFANDNRYVEMSARLLAARGKLDLALGKLDEIKDVDLSTILQKAILSIRAGKYAEAINFIEILEKELPDDPGILNLRASVLLRTSEEEKAEALYRNILASLPSHFEAKFNLTNKLYNEGRIEEALKFAQELYEEQERNTQVLTLYGRVLMQNSSPEKALEILQLASTIAPREVSVKEALIDLYISQSDYRDALSEINSLLKDDFLNARYINKRSRIYLALEQNTKAKEDFQTLFGLYNNDVSNLYQLSLLQSQIDDPRGLIKTLERIIEIDADNFYAKRDRIRALLDTRQLELAKDSLALLIKEYPKNPDLMLLEGNYQLYTGNKKKAAEYYIDAIKLQNTLTPALISAYQLALEGVGERQFIVQFMQLAKAPENNPFATHLLADYYSQGGNGAEAKALYILLANQSAYVGKPLVLNNLANIYIDEGKLDTAFNYAEQAYNALPGNQAILDTYGWVASLQGKHEFALDLLRSSFAMNASDPEVRYHIAITLHKLNRNEEALDEIAILLSDFADFKYRNDAIALQQQIQNEAALR